MWNNKGQRLPSTSPYVAPSLLTEQFICLGVRGAEDITFVQVQSGGSFDVDYSVMGPDGKVIMENSKERQLDSVFTAKVTGEYSFCFNNEMSTFAEKMVDFEIAVRVAPLPTLDARFQLGQLHGTPNPSRNLSTSKNA